MAGRDNPRDDKVGGLSFETKAAFAVLGGFVGINVLAWICQRAAVKFSGADAASPPNPVVAAFMIAFSDDYPWPTMATVIAVVVVAVVTTAVVLIRMATRKRTKRKQETGEKTRIDHVTRHLASPTDVRSLSPESRRNAHLRKKLPDIGWYGFTIGNEVDSGQPLLSGAEDQVVDIWAPRQGKSTSRVLPQIYSAPGLLVTTSCKRDVIEMTAKYRSLVGEVWVFDPQDMAPDLQGDPWYFDPLDYVRRDSAWDSNATTLADIFDAATNDHGDVADGQNSFFYQQARKLLKGMFLAAAVADMPITSAFRWVMRPDDDEPLRILKDSTWTNVSLGMEAQYDEEERTRSNVFAAAANVVECLSTQSVERWVTPRAGARKLSVSDLAADETASLFLMTKDDEPVARPITSVLVVMILKELEARAERYPRNRLPVPAAMPLDEIANVVRWPQLPTKFSTYGSLGILVDVVLQSWVQGEEMWGVSGMRKLWSAAGVRVIGPGQTDDEFAAKISRMIGSHTEIKSSKSYGSNGGSASEDVVEKETLPASEIQALPEFRMIVQATGRRPMLARMVRWQDQSYSPEVEQRLERAGLRGDGQVESAAVIDHDETIGARTDVR